MKYYICENDELIIRDEKNKVMFVTNKIKWLKYDYDYYNKTIYREVSTLIGNIRKYDI